MNGADSLMKALAKEGVKVCFANPGTSEMHLVNALDSQGEIRSILCLFEGVCTGAADGYGACGVRAAAAHSGESESDDALSWSVGGEPQW